MRLEGGMRGNGGTDWRETSVDGIEESEEVGSQRGQNPRQMAEWWRVGARHCCAAAVSSWRVSTSARAGRTHALYGRVARVP